MTYRSMTADYFKVRGSINQISKKGNNGLLYSTLVSQFKK